MSSNTSDCSCNDYSLLAANTGIGTVSVANSNLNGSGATSVICTGSGNGTIINTIIIKAVSQVYSGMVRLFIRNGGGIALIREIPIPTFPLSATTTIPPFYYPTLEIDLVDPIVLAPGDSLLASTQNAQTFNVIAVATNFTYPATLPPTCCNFAQYVNQTNNSTVSVANPATDGTGTIVNIFQSAGANGSKVSSITVSALQSTLQGLIRLFVGTSASSYVLIAEVVVPASSPSGTSPSFKVQLNNFITLQNGYVLGAATNIAQSFSIAVAAQNWIYPPNI